VQLYAACSTVTQFLSVLNIVTVLHDWDAFVYLLMYTVSAGRTCGMQDIRYMSIIHFDTRYHTSYKLVLLLPKTLVKTKTILGQCYIKHRTQT
jgi:hypothetical protein